MQKYKVKIKEIIEHEFEVEEVNEYMAKEEAIKLLKGRLMNRAWCSHDDIHLEKIE